MGGQIERGPYGAQYIVTSQAESAEIGYQMDILMQARPDWLLPVYRQATVRGCRYAYPVTGLESIADPAASKRIGRRQALKLVQRLRQDLETLPDHLLTPDQVLLTPDALFIDPVAERFLLVYRPFLPVDGAATLDELIEWLGEQICHNHLLRRRWVAAARIAAGPEATAESSTAARNAPGPEATAESGPWRLRHAFGRLLPWIAAGLAAPALAAAAFMSPAWPGSRQAAIRDLRLPLLILLLLVTPTLILLLRKQRTATGTEASPAQLPARKPLDVPCEHPPKLLPCEHPLELPCAERQPTSAKPTLADAQPFAARLRSLAARLDPRPLIRKASTGFRKRLAESPASQARMHDQPTQLLSSRQELFRLATLSEGMIGTGAETAGQRAFILSEEFVIGRDFRTVDLCLTGYAVGRRHARIVRRGAAFFISDLGSKNGTRLNGERLNKLEEYLLPDRCQLQFADRLFYFEAEQLPVGA